MKYLGFELGEGKRRMVASDFCDLWVPGGLRYDEEPLCWLQTRAHCTTPTTTLVYEEVNLEVRISVVAETGRSLFDTFSRSDPPGTT